MPGQRLPMRKILDVLRLRADDLSKRKIAASLSIGVTTAGEIIRRVRRAGLSWPLPENLSDEAIERLVYPHDIDLSSNRDDLRGYPATIATRLRSGNICDQEVSSREAMRLACHNATSDSTQTTTPRLSVFAVVPVSLNGFGNRPSLINA